MEVGKRFSQMYLKRGAPSRDNHRFRNRVSAYFWENHQSQHREIANLIHTETGAQVPVIGTRYGVERFFEKGELRDVLDSLTLVYKVLNQAFHVADK